MRKIGFIVFAFIVMAQVGCKRTCTECTYRWELANGEKIYTHQPDFCGNPDQIKAYKEDEVIKARQLAAKVGGKNVTLQCIDQK